MDPVTLTTLGLSLASLVVSALAHRAATNASGQTKPVIDPTNQRPLVDVVRDGFSAILVLLGGGQASQPSPKVPAPAPNSQPVDIVALLQMFLDHLKATQQPAQPQVPAK